MTLAELNRYIVDQLAGHLGDGEARATARLLLEDDLKVTPTVLVTRGDRVLEPETVGRFREYCRRIAAGEPPQYVVGRSTFMGLEFNVTPDVLVPRPETAGLVDLITDDCGSRRDLKVIDIGTGSGCIAISLARALVFPSVVAADVSEPALTVAEGNARRLGVNVDFVKMDILKEPAPVVASYDVVVSNPPYIAMKEKADMEARVLEHEPHLALFVPDDDPLQYYRAIGHWSRAALKDGGRLYFEINPLYSSQLARLLADQGFTDVEILPDFHGRKRYARAVSRK